jgi:hypothetical protein
VNSMNNRSTLVIPPRPVIRWPGRKPRSVAIPPARDPFVNTRLIRLTPDENGLDRFWISSFNSAFGSLGVCINETGDHRVYPSGSFHHAGFYSAVQTKDDTLWLCYKLSHMVRLNLCTGEFKAFPTGAPPAMAFAGMAFDPSTGKVFAIAHSGPNIVGVSFDTRNGSTAKIHELSTQDHYMRFSFPNGDGTYTIELQCPGLTFVRWDPRTETVVPRRLMKILDLHTEGSLVYQMIRGNDGRVYMPGHGWYEPRTGRIGAGPRPEKDNLTWFARDRISAYGVPLGGSSVHRWLFKTGQVREVVASLGMGFMNTNLTRSGKLLCVTKDGFFTRHDAKTGELEMSRRLDTDNIQGVDCVIRIDRDRVLGTPFITQRFWEANLRTQTGYDCGAVAPGGGEILRVWKLGGRIYLAAYTGGELMEYNPAEHPHFPENPRVVAKPPTGMRPVASADDGRRIFYACSHHYGHLGSTLTRYDTRTGMVFNRENPLPDQQIVSLCYEKASNSLLCGTTYEADGASVPPATRDTVLARLDAETFNSVKTCKGPTGSTGIRLIGPLGRNRWLGTCWGQFPDGSGARWFEFDAATFHTPKSDALRKLEGWGTSTWDWSTIQYAGKPGYFVCRVGPRVELWDMRKFRRVKVLGDTIEICGFFVQEQDVLIWTAWDVFVLENVLP